MPTIPSTHSLTQLSTLAALAKQPKFSGTDPEDKGLPLPGSITGSAASVDIFSSDFHMGLGGRRIQRSLISQNPDVNDALIAQADKLDLTEAAELELRQVAEGLLGLGEKDSLLKALTEASGQPLDLTQLKRQYLTTFFQDHRVRVGKLSDEQVQAWSHLQFMDDLGYELDRSRFQDRLRDLCEATLAGTYRDWLQTPGTERGLVNKYTQQTFAATGLNYDTWMNYDGVVTYKKPTYEEALDSIRGNLENLINILTESNGGEREAKLAEIGFTLTKGKLASTTGTLTALQVEDLLFELRALPQVQASDDPVVSLVQSGLEKLGLSKKPLSAERVREERMNAGFTLQRLHKTLRGLQKIGNDDPISIRLWKRNPAHDLFQANFTGSCIALGGGNSEASLLVLENTFVQLAEFYNEEKKQVTGKALMLWARDLKAGGEPVLIINTFEGRDDGCEEDTRSQQALKKFAEEFGKAVAGRPVRVYTGETWNTLRTDNLEHTRLDLHPIGDCVGGTYYLDTFGMAPTKVNTPHRNTGIYALSTPKRFGIKRA